MSKHLSRDDVNKLDMDHLEGFQTDTFLQDAGVDKTDAKALNWWESDATYAQIRKVYAIAKFTGGTGDQLNDVVNFRHAKMGEIMDLIDSIEGNVERIVERHDMIEQKTGVRPDLDFVWFKADYHRHVNEQKNNPGQSSGGGLF